MMDSTNPCFNCGLERKHDYRISLRIRPKNDYQRETRRMVLCCSEECAYQAAFLQLKTVSTRDRVTRFLSDRPIRYAEFRRLPLEVLSDCPE